VRAAVRPEEILDGLFQSIDAMEVDKFVQFLTEDGEFRFGSAPAVRGRAAISEAVQGFFDSISGLSHSVNRVWRDDASLACEGEVCYQRHDGTEIVVPFVDVFELQGDLISSYKIYIDIAPLFAQ